MQNISASYKLQTSASISNLHSGALSPTTFIRNLPKMRNYFQMLHVTNKTSTSKHNLRFDPNVRVFFLRSIKNVSLLSQGKPIPKEQKIYKKQTDQRQRSTVPCLSLSLSASFLTFPSAYIPGTVNGLQQATYVSNVFLAIQIL